MSVLIKGMEMPKDCNNCKFFDDNYDYPTCSVTDNSRGYNWNPRGQRMQDCPLVPVPPHGSLIDADTLRKKYYCGENIRHDLITVPVTNILYHIDNAPTVIEAESYSERELQRDYEASVEYAQHCGRYEPTYDPETGAM